MNNSLTHFMNEITGERLDRLTLDGLRAKAHDLFEANTAIFEDELDALGALGVVSVLDNEPALAA